MKSQYRTEPREAVSLPVELDGVVSVVTSNISASGLYFETESLQHLGDVVHLEINLDTPGGPMKLKAQGQIVRIEFHGNRTGVAVKLLDSKLEAID